MYQSSPRSQANQVVTLPRIIILLSLLAVFLTGWQLHVASSLATQGEYIRLTQTRVQALKTQNLKLKEALLERQSFSYLTSQATKLGFVPTSRLVYLPASSQAVAVLVGQAEPY